MQGMREVSLPAPVVDVERESFRAALATILELPQGEGAVTRDWIASGFVVGASDIALALPSRAETPRTAGVLEQIRLAASAGEPARALADARARAGRGLEGDRHTIGTGTFPSGLPGSALTLIEAEVCDSFDPPLAADEHRRNLVTRVPVRFRHRRPATVASLLR